MGFLGKALSGIMTTLLWPIEQLVGNTLYGIFIKGPLITLNILDNAFNYLAGSKVEGLLFGTSSKDGKLDVNFFASDSPLKYIFMVSLGIGGVLLALFISISIIAKMYKGKLNPIQKMLSAIGSGIAVFIIPVCFITVLSLSSSFLSMITGANLVMGKTNIKAFNESTLVQVQKLDNSVSNTSRIWKSDTLFNKTTDFNGIEKRMSANDIYREFNKKKKETYDEFLNKNIVTNVNTNKEAYINLKKYLVDTSSVNGSIVVTKSISYKNTLDSIKKIISELKVEEKDQKKAEVIKKQINNLYIVRNLISEYRRTALNVLKYISDKLIAAKKGANGTPIDSSKITKQGWLLNNFKMMYENFYGSNDVTQNNSSIQTLQDLAININFLVDGQATSFGSGLNSLKLILSPYKESSLTVIFYQLATGNKDSNWENSSYGSKSKTGSVFFGILLIIGAILIMTISLFYVCMRIIDLAVLFVISPLVVTFAPLDDGARTKTWVKVTMGKMLSIFGIVISLRVFASIAGGFDSFLQKSTFFEGEQGHIIRLTITGIFYISGMLAAYLSTQTIASLVGAGQGIMQGMQAMRTAKILATGGKAALKGSTSVIKGTAKGVGKTGSVVRKNNVFASHGRQNLKNWSRKTGGNIATKAGAVATAATLGIVPIGKMARIRRNKAIRSAERDKIVLDHKRESIMTDESNKKQVKDDK